MPRSEHAIGSLDCRACERPGISNVFATAAFYQGQSDAGRYKQPCLRPLQHRKSEPMLFWIAAIGSTWGAYALGFERLIGVPDHAETSHGGRQSRMAQEKDRTTDQR
jgi:hypothetical protein